MRAARSSMVEHSADNRETKVRLLPGRLRETNERFAVNGNDGTKALVAERLAHIKITLVFITHCFNHKSLRYSKCSNRITRR
jgi:hypothetical protein